MNIYAVHLLEKPEEPFTVIMETAPVHTQERPFCDDMTCGCHSDGALIYEYIPPSFILDGLMTYEEYYRLYEGRQL